MALSVAVLPMSSKILDISYSDPEHFEVTRTEVVDGLMDFVIGSGRGDVAFFFMDGYSGLNEPYLKLRGIGTRVVADFGNDVREVTFTPPIDAEVVYLLSRAQVAALAEKGLFHNPEFRDFSSVPRIFPGNTLQVPVKCKFCYVNPIIPKYYAEAEPESSLLMVDVLQSEGIITTERESGYNLVEYFEQAPMTAWEMGDLDGMQYDAEVQQILGEQKEQGFVVLSKAPELTDQVAIRNMEAEAEAQASNDIYQAVSDRLAHIDSKTHESRKRRLEELGATEAVSELETDIQEVADEVKEVAEASPAEKANDFTQDIFASMSNFGLDSMFAERQAGQSAEASAGTASLPDDLFSTGTKDLEPTVVEPESVDVVEVTESIENVPLEDVAKAEAQESTKVSEVAQRMSVFDDIFQPREPVIDDSGEQQRTYSDSMPDEEKRRREVLEKKRAELEAQQEVLSDDLFADVSIEDSLDIQMEERKQENQRKVEKFNRDEANQLRALELAEEHPEDIEGYIGQLDPSLQGTAAEALKATGNPVIATAAVAAAASSPRDRQAAVNEIFKNFPQHEAKPLQEKNVGAAPGDPLYGIEIPEDPEAKLQEAIDSMEPDGRDITTQDLFDNYDMV